MPACALYNPKRAYTVCVAITKTAVFVAYYRISPVASDETRNEGSLGIDAQKFAIARFMGEGKLVAEFTEVESGKSHTNRPQLLAALAECKRHKATLVIAKLDRLARNVAFISSLMESGTEFIACDMPTASRLTIHILAAVAEHEREMISQRTKLALAEAKRRGVKLGNPRLHEAREKSLMVSRVKAPAQEVLTLMVDWRRGKRWTYSRIAQELNRLNIKPSRGKQWYGSSVRDQLMRVTNK